MYLCAPFTRALVKLTLRFWHAESDALYWSTYVAVSVLFGNKSNNTTMRIYVRMC